jgi:hypothetical protein
VWKVREWWKAEPLSQTGDDPRLFEAFLKLGGARLSEYWIVCTCDHTEHDNAEDAQREHKVLSAHFPDRKLRLHRCKHFMQPARHFDKMVELLADIKRDGLTAANGDRADVLLTTIGNRTPRLKTLTVPKKPLPLVEVSAP